MVLTYFRQANSVSGFWTTGRQANRVKGFQPLLEIPSSQPENSGRLWRWLKRIVNRRARHVIRIVGQSLHTPKTIMR